MQVGRSTHPLQDVDNIAALEANVAHHFKHIFEMQSTPAFGQRVSESLDGPMVAAGLGDRLQLAKSYAIHEMGQLISQFSPRVTLDSDHKVLDLKILKGLSTGDTPASTAASSETIQHQAQISLTMGQTIENVLSLTDTAVGQFMEGAIDYHQMVRNITFGSTKAMFDRLDQLEANGGLESAIDEMENSTTNQNAAASFSSIDQYLASDTSAGSQALQQGLQVLNGESQRRFAPELQRFVMAQMFKV